MLVIDLMYRYQIFGLFLSMVFGAYCRYLITSDGLTFIKSLVFILSFLGFLASTIATGFFSSTAALVAGFCFPFLAGIIRYLF